MINPELFAEVVREAGSLTALADALGETPQLVSNWRHRSFPANKCKAIEAITGISVQRLRPDDWREYWPPLTIKTAA